MHILFVNCYVVALIETTIADRINIMMHIFQIKNTSLLVIIQNRIQNILLKDTTFLCK